jgi:hypothetical protein
MQGEQELTEFLTRDIPYFMHSVTGPMLDQITALAYGSRECPRCFGVGILDEAWERTRDANGKKCDPVMIQTGKDCPCCKGVGCLPVRMRVSKNPLTAQPKHSQERTVKGAPPDDVICRFARVSRRLMQMGPRLGEALLSAYGDEGDVQAREGGRGRAWAAAPLTEAGKAMIYWMCSNTSHDGSCRGIPALTAYVRIVAARSKPKPEELALVAEATAQSEALVAEAEKAWESLL